MHRMGLLGILLPCFLWGLPVTSGQAIEQADGCKWKYSEVFSFDLTTLADVLAYDFSAIRARPTRLALAYDPLVSTLVFGLIAAICLASRACVCSKQDYTFAEDDGFNDNGKLNTNSTPGHSFAARVTRATIASVRVRCRCSLQELSSTEAVRSGG